MNSEQKARRGKRNTNRLIRNGYTALSRLTLALARTGLVDPFLSAKSILPRRAISVVSILPAAAKKVKLQLSLATARVKLERGGATLTVKFFGLFGRQFNRASIKLSHDLFADTIDTVAAQNVYFEVPNGAKWMLVKVERSGSSRRIGIHGSLRPKAIESDTLGSLEEALASRDRMQLEAHLAAGNAAKDRTIALRILERLIYLEKTEAEETLHRMIADLDSVFMRLPNRLAGDETQNVFDYTHPLVGEYSPSIPLSKWLALETRALRGAAGQASVHLSGSDYAGAQLLACLYAKLPFTLKDCERHRLASFHPWVFDCDFNEILAFNP